VALAWQQDHRRSTIDIHQLELFLAVIDSPSMTQAAERVYLSPGAISLQLHNLADELQTELFARSGNGKRLIPTPAAMRLAEQARRLVNLSRQIKQEFHNDLKRDTKPFYFSTGVTTLIYQLGEPLKHLRREYSQAAIRIVVNTTEDTLTGLLDRRYDLGLISLPIAEESLKNIKVIPLFEEELLIVCPAASIPQAGQITSMRASELAGVPFLLYPQGTVLRILIDRFFENIGVTPNVVMEADDTEAIKRLVEAGFGYSIIPEHALRERTRSVRTYRVEKHPIRRSLSLAMVRTDFQRKLTLSIADSLKKLLLAELRRSDQGSPAIALRA
jgi:DNA-binding transcriptional LysR family regulator